MPTTKVLNKCKQEGSSQTVDYKAITVGVRTCAFAVCTPASKSLWTKQSHFPNLLLTQGVMGSTLSLWTWTTFNRHWTPQFSETENKVLEMRSLSPDSLIVLPFMSLQTDMNTSADISLYTKYTVNTNMTVSVTLCCDVVYLSLHQQMTEHLAFSYVRSELCVFFNFLSLVLWHLLVFYAVW